MTRSKEDIELLKELGYDPDDPSYIVENYGDDEVTATETGTVMENITNLKIAVQAAIEALQKVQDMLK